MKFLRLLLTLSSFIACIMQSHAQQELQAGVMYSAGTQLTVSQLGVTFTIPSGFQGGLPEGSEFFMMDAVAGDASAFILADSYTDASLKTELAANIPIDAMSGLTPEATPVQKGKLISNRFASYGMGDFKAYAVGKSGDHGMGLGVVILAAPATLKSYMPPMDKMISNAKLEKPIAPLVASEPDFNGDWKAYMTGRHLHYLNTSNGMSSSEKIWLCSDGSCAFYSHDNYMSNDAYSEFSGTVNSGDRIGNWDVVGNTLVLNLDDGGVKEFTLELNDEGLHLNGYRYFRVDNERCR